MGCFSSKSRNIQQHKISTNMQESNTNLQYSQLQLTQQQQHQLCLNIHQLNSILISHQISQENKPTQFLKKLQPNAYKNSIKISSYLVKLLQNFSTDQSIDKQHIRQCIAVSYGIVCQGQNYKVYQKYGKKQFDLWGDYLITQNNYQTIEFTIRFIQKMFLDHGFTAYANSQKLFKAIITKFNELATDQSRSLATQVIVQMLLDNKKLLKHVNQPYLFLQFWLYQINQQSQLDRQLYWIQSVKKLYGSDNHAQDYLFHDNDFKVFIDLLVRVMGQCPDGNKLKIPLECYLTLSCCKKMGVKILRIDDVKQFVMALDGNALGIQNLLKQIRQLE